MADNFQVPSTLPDGDPGVNIHALERTVNGATVKVGVSVTVDPTDPTKRQAVDATYGAAVDVTRSALPALAATSTAQATGNASLASLDGKAPALVSGRVPVDGSGVTQPVSGPLTDAQLRATAVQVSGPITDAQLRATAVPVSVASVPTHGVTGPLTDTELRASAVPVSAASLPLPANAATSAKQDTAQTSLTSIDGKLPAQGQALAAASLPVVLPAAQVSALTPPAAITGFALESGGNLAALVSEVGATNETAPGSDTAPAGQNGRLQRIAQRLSSLIALLPSALGQAAMSASSPVTMASDQTPVPVGSSIAQPTASFTRPADTTAYTIGDVVCNSTSAPVVLTFANMARVNGGAGVIAAFQMVLGSNPSTKPTYDLMLFDTAPTIDNDNAQFTPTDAEMLKFVGRIQLSVPTVGDTSGTGTNCVYVSNDPLTYKCDAASTSLFGVLVARNAVTPASADTYNFRALVAHLN